MNRAGGVRRHGAPLVLMVASGFAGLGYQIVWTQQCALWLGHEAAAVLAVVAAFFGGLASGALLLGARIESSARPARWYAGCELAIALWSLLLSRAMPLFSGWVLRFTGAQPAPAWQWSVAFCGTFLLLLPATAAMGATLPAMERITAHLRDQRSDGDGRSIARLYAGNMSGAVVGVLAVAFWLVPAIGLSRTALVCMALNLLCAGMSLAVFPAVVAVPPRAPALNAEPRVESARLHAGARSAILRLAVTGFLGIGYEVLVVRVLSQVTEDTVYTFAILLAVYLVGSAAGAAGYQRWSKLAAKDLDADSDALGDWLLVALAASCLLGTLTLFAAQRVKAVAQRLLGGGATAAIAVALLAEAVPALLAFGSPTLIMGALFSHLSRRAHASGVSFGRALGANTLGAAAAPAIFGVLALPAFGPKRALLLIVVGYLALLAGGYLALRAGGYLALRARGSSFLRRVSVAAGGTLAGALALALWAPPLAFIDVPDGGRVVSYQDGVMASVSVVEDADGVARLRINNRQQEGSSATLRVDGRQAWLPLLLHPAPRAALFLGLGTGVTAASAAEDPTLQVDAVELLPEVIAASAHFTRGLANGAAAGDGNVDVPARLNVIAADARRYVRASDRGYDVIVSDNFHPARSGSGSLYTVEHFQAVRLRLRPGGQRPGGLFCQWLPLHQLDLDTLRSIVRSFLVAYPQALALLASNSLETPVLALIGRVDDSRFDLAAVRARLARVASPEPAGARLGGRLADRLGARLAGRLARLGLEDELAVLGSFVAGPAALRRFAGHAPVNSDDHPVVSYRAPRITYAPDSSPRDRLIALLHELSIQPGELILPAPDQDAPRRLAAYWLARNRFIESGRDVRPSPRVQEMLAQVREPLLSVLRVSPDFRPAYDPLLAMATALAGSDPGGARTLLNDLARIQPARVEAAQTLLRLFH